MFRHEGPGRSVRQNEAVAAILAFVGGYVNSAGFLVVGAFTSHVTGNLGHLAADVAARRVPEALVLCGIVLAFFLGALLASLLLEGGRGERRPRAYAWALAIEALFLAAFAWTHRRGVVHDASSRDVGVALLAASMGMQNSLVTRLSGAVVRTTHMTGVVTDLGIESARWLRWWTRPVGEDRPAPEKAELLAVILVSFAIGSVVGALAAAWLGGTSVLVGAGAVGGCAIYALARGR